LLYPVFLAMVRRLGWQYALTVVAAVELGLRLGWDVYALTVGGQVSALVDNSPFFFWFSWAIGAALADAYLKGESPPFARVSPLVWLTLAIAADLIRPLNIFSFTLVALTTAAAIARMLDARSGREVRRRPAARGILLEHVRLAGVYSYSIYLIHHPIVAAWPRLVRAVLPGADAHPLLMYACCLASWAVIVPLSGFMYRSVELPAIDWGKRVVADLRRRRAAEKPAAEMP
jgi:peptidoglycan/LPS O-acetylase OafA/YrhL